MRPDEINPGLSRVRFQLSAAGVKPAQVARLRSGIHSRGYLPHVKREGASYFVTFRLFDSLPRDVLFKLQGERAVRLAQISAQTKDPTSTPSSEKLRQIEREYFMKAEEYLDKGCGNCWLRRGDIAEVASNALRFFDGERYLLKAWVVMPTHVHVVVWPAPNQTLSGVLKSWKTFTGREANKLLNRSGQPFWQPESYDHWIRDEIEHEQCCRYVINNPVKAGLCKSPAEWPWSSAAWK